MFVLCLKHSDSRKTTSFDELRLDINEELENDSFEKDEEAVNEKQRSVISHLLSQVRIGMDLTKITLPTFILESRSLLEMFADFLAYPDLWLAIADGHTEEERMIACLKWYLTSFRAGRNPVVAKKPYNPTLGEIFQSYYDMEYLFPQEGDNSTQDGPVPWAKERDVQVVAEQVSHHPPISAFYAENSLKKMSMNGHVWTKSKFLGLSIGVSLIGKAVISMLDYNEQYTITFPSCYGRSILTTPWMELGGKTQITSTNGFTADIEFHTKPFYGSKKHFVDAYVMAPGAESNRKPILCVKGEWNGVLEAQWTSYSGKADFTIDTNKLKPQPKRVRPLDQQDQQESRRLWRNVTYYLSKNDVSKAAKYKSSIEQKQRDEERERKNMNCQWKPKLFREVSTDWLYVNQLEDRIISCNN
ncbi:DgyrCDS9923 [Dimorphilus gyrociliatus]|uniref:Oxysterol-binding protein n=1 Tax=Dimorphilus gyrociliatus TaxID=2664684 RepID=A0A7I8W033_9ANNE|nr:DgyrCDS9923 [Dimorphilus gyrociliatus]